jgi:hypothetical protein
VLGHRIYGLCDQGCCKQRLGLKVWSRTLAVVRLEVVASSASSLFDPGTTLRGFV